MRRALQGMVAVITGASAGIGRALAEGLSARGAQLALAARRADRLDELNRSLGGTHLVVSTDVAVPEQCEALVRQAVDRFGRVDALVCNAGYGLHCPVASTSADELRLMFQTNVFGTTDCIRAAVPVMRRQALRDGYRGQVVIVTSAVARRGLPYFGAYSATKAAQLSLAEAMRVELKDDASAVTTVHPIGTDTEFWDVSAAGGDAGRVRAAGVRQTAGQVAEATIRGIQRPRPEVWPFRPARWGLSLATLFPSLVDRVLVKRMRSEGMV